MRGTCIFPVCYILRSNGQMPMLSQLVTRCSRDVPDGSVCGHIEDVEEDPQSELLSVRVAGHFLGAFPRI